MTALAQTNHALDKIASKSAVRAVRETRKEFQRRHRRPAERSDAAVLVNNHTALVVRDPETTRAVGTDTRRLKHVPNATYVFVQRDGRMVNLVPCTRDGAPLVAPMRVPVDRWQRGSRLRHAHPVVVAHMEDGTIFQMTTQAWRRARNALLAVPKSERRPAPPKPRRKPQAVFATAGGDTVTVWKDEPQTVTVTVKTYARKARVRLPVGRFHSFADLYRAVKAAN